MSQSSADLDIVLSESAKWKYSDREPDRIELSERDIAAIEDLNDDVAASERYNENWVLQIWSDGPASEDGRTEYKWKTNSVVGIIGLPSRRRLRIEPRKSPDRLGWLLQYALRIEPVLGTTETRVGDGTGFIDALAALYASELDEALRGGIDREYQSVERDRSSIRGRLDLTSQLRRHGSTATSFACRHDELTTDTPLNRALLLAAGEFKVRTNIPSLTADLERLERRLARHVPRAAVSTQELADVTLTRLNERYHDSFRIARYVIDGRDVGGFDEAADVFSLLFSLSTVFEDVARRALEEGGLRDAGWTVDAQAKRSVTEGGEFLIRPDFLVSDESGNSTLVGDAKWKSDNRRKPRRSDLYQLISYQTIESAPGILVYPAQERSFAPAVLRIRGGDPLYILELPTNADVSNYAAYADRLRDAASEVFGAVHETIVEAD